MRDRYQKLQQVYIMFIFSNLRRYCGTSFIAEKMSWERSSGGFSFDLRVIAGGEGDVGARSAEHAVDFSMRRFDAVIGNGSNDD